MKSCKNCPNKGCGSFHDKCEKYNTEKELLRKAREKERINGMCVRKGRR